MDEDSSTPNTISMLTKQLPSSPFFLAKGGRDGPSTSKQERLDYRSAAFQVLMYCFILFASVSYVIILFQEDTKFLRLGRLKFLK